MVFCFVFLHTMKRQTIYLRNEINPDEYRTPITPRDVGILIRYGYCIYVQNSNHRIYSNDEYAIYGAIITDIPWYDLQTKNTIIIGLKDLPELHKLNNHTHIFFAHCFQEQSGSALILNTFKNSQSIIYDFEYFTDGSGKRLLAFGKYAGNVGCTIGLLQFTEKNTNNANIKSLQPWSNKEIMLKSIMNYKTSASFFTNIRIGIIGANGRCGKGVAQVLDSLGIFYTKIDRENITNSFLKSFDILYNCILLDKHSTDIWFDQNTVFENPMIIVDISCDYSKPNNPIQIYDNPTSWSEPVYNYNEMVSIIAINNLPSLLPKDSSDYFSGVFTELILEENVDEGVWARTKKVFMDIR